MQLLQPETFGSLLKRFRVRKGLTQEALASKARLSPETIRKLEQGDRKSPYPNTITSLAGALDLSLRERDQLFTLAGRHIPPIPLVSRYHPDAHESTRMPDLIGRDRELDRLRQHLTAHASQMNNVTGTRSDTPSVLVFAGEPGIGKSHLLSATYHEAQVQGWAVLQSGCSWSEDSEPYSPVLDAIRHHLGTQSAQARKVSLRGCTILAAILSRLGEMPEISRRPAIAPGNDERHQLFIAVRQFLANCAGPCGTVLILDDMQWAGTDAVGLLASIIQMQHLFSMPLPPLAIVCAYQSTSLAPESPWAILLADWASTKRVHQVMLPPLLREDAARLFDSIAQGEAVAGGGSQPPVAADLRDWILTRANGNPFFITSFANDLRDGVIIDQTGGYIPLSIAQSFQGRWRKLTPTGRVLLQIIATAGTPLPANVLHTLVHELGELKQPALVGTLHALADLCRAGLCRDAGNGTTTIAHTIIREAILADMPTAFGTYIHTLLAKTLEHLPDQQRSDHSVAALAWHHAAAGNTRQALPYMLASADLAVSVYAYAEAEHRYHTACDWAQALMKWESAAAAAEGMGGILSRRGHYTQAMTMMEQAISWYEQEQDHAGVARVTAQLGWVYSLAYQAEAGIARLMPLLQSTLAHHSKALLYDALANLYFMAGRYTERMLMLEQGEAFAQLAQDHPLVARFVRQRGANLVFLGELARAKVTQEEAITLCQQCGDAWSLSHAWLDVSMVHGLQGKSPEHRHCIDQALKLAPQVGDPTIVAYAHFFRGRSFFLEGAWKEACKDWAESRKIYAGVTSQQSPWLLAIMGRHAVLTGNEEQGIEYLQTALVEAKRTGYTHALFEAQGMLAEVDLVHGKKEAGLARLTQLFHQMEQLSGEPVMMLAALAWPWSYLALRDDLYISKALTEAIAKAAELDLPLALLEGHQFLLIQALREKRYDDALNLVKEALKMCAAIPSYLYQARVLSMAQFLHLQRQDHHQAADYEKQVQAIAQRLDPQCDMRYLQAIWSLL